MTTNLALGVLIVALLVAAGVALRAYLSRIDR